MFSKKHKAGLTIVELMVVIAIIAILATLAISAIRGNKSQEALVDLSNDIVSALNAQRTRALTTNLATYVMFTAGAASAVTLAIGNDSKCSPANHANIVYTNSVVQVGIDLGTIPGPRRTLSAAQSNKYYNANDPLVNITLALLQLGDDYRLQPVAVNPNAITVCFQPNGQVVFYNGAGQAIAQQAEIRVRARDADAVGGSVRISVSGVGHIASQAVADTP